jgi:hypothetical protein
MISSEQKRKAKEKMFTEFKRYVVLTVYLWVLLSMFEIHRFAVLREVEHASVSGYRIGFAAINALIMAKVLLIGEAIHLGEQFSEKRVIYCVLFKSVVFALFAICCNVVEGAIVGLIHGTPIRTSIPQMGGGGLLGIALYGIMASIVLVPLFLFEELRRSLGTDTLHSLILQSRPKADTQTGPRTKAA